jgi:hypothetical protein
MRLFGPVYDPVTPEWKKLAFCCFFLLAALLIYPGRSRPQYRFVTALLLAVSAVKFVLAIYVFR